MRNKEQEAWLELQTVFMDQYFDLRLELSERYEGVIPAVYQTAIWKVVAQPRGPAPSWVRGAWVGLTLPAHLFLPTNWGLVPQIENQDQGGFKQVDGIAVLASWAISVLGQKSPQAAAWFKENWPSEGMFFHQDYLEFEGYGMVWQVSDSDTVEIRRYPDEIQEKLLAPLN